MTRKRHCCKGGGDNHRFSNIEHYEIASYGCLVALAKKMGHTEAAKLLEETLEEEKNADELLTKIAEEHVNEDASEE